MLREAQAARLMLFTKGIYTSCVIEEWIARRQTVLLKILKLDRKAALVKTRSIDMAVM